MMKKILLALTFSVFWLCAQAQAADPFTVAGVPVDATGPSAISAMTTAREDGRVRAAKTLINRLTLPEERQSKNVPLLDKDAVAPFIRSISMANEKRSANRYLGEMTVAFTPSLIQTYLADNGLTMIANQSRERLVLPVLDGRPLWTDNAWNAAWQSGIYGHSLTPVKAIANERGDTSLIDTAAATGRDMQALVRTGKRYGLNQILIVDARTSGSSVKVKVSDVAIDTGQIRDLGTVSGRDYRAAAAAVIALLEKDWKQTSVSMSNNAAIMTVSVLYRTHDEWTELQDAINGSTQIQDARLDALSKDGALMTLTYAGDIARLENELRFKGVEIKNHPQYGVVLARAGRY